MQGASQQQQQQQQPQQQSQSNTPQQSQQQSQPRTSTIDVPVRILVPSESVGAIIGKGGQTIRQLTQQTRAKVDVYRGDPLTPASALQEKVITIRGQPDNCINACKEILKVMRQDAENKGKPCTSQDIPLKVLAHNDYIGRIIGKQGNIINKIKEETNTQVAVSSINDMSMNVERVITVKGELDNMIQALEIIHQKIKTAFENDTKTYGAQAIMMGGIPPIPLIPPQYAYAAAQAAAVAANPQTQTRYQTGLGASPSTYGAFYPPLMPTPGGLYNPNMIPPQAPNAAPIPAPTQVTPTSATNGPSSQQTQNQQVTPNGVQSTQSDYSPDTETVRLYIPNVAVGAIIGTKGSFIKNIIKLSGASVKITPMTQEESKQAIEREVVIIGSPESQWKAQYYIYEKIRQERFASDENFKLRAEIDVPASLVGRIIGKSGKNVRELQRSTGAVIKLPEDSQTSSGNNSQASSSNSPTTSQIIVSILGSFNSSQCAQRRIQTLVAQSRGGVAAAFYRATPNFTAYQMQPLIQTTAAQMNHRMNGKTNRRHYHNNHHQHQQQNGSSNQHHHDYEQQHHQHQHENHETSQNEQQQQQQ